MQRLVPCTCEQCRVPKNGPFRLRAQGMQLVLITRDVNIRVHSSRVWLRCACILACVGLVGFKLFEIRGKNDECSMEDLSRYML